MSCWRLIGLCLCEISWTGKGVEGLGPQVATQSNCRATSPHWLYVHVSHTIDGSSTTSL